VPVDLKWPLVGRTAELNRVAERIRSGGGAVILAGPAGVGKTRLATECLSVAASTGFAPLRVSATAATARLPFGAFANLLPDLGGGIPQPALLRQVSQSIASRGAGAPVAVMVDDAHLLDDSSASLTYELARTADLFVIATLRSGTAASSAVVALWKDELADRIEVHPLEAAEVQELLVASLGGPVEGASLQLFQERAQGNALFLRELVLGAIDTKILEQANGMWRLTGDLAIPPRLGEIIESRLANVSERDRRALEVLAVGEPLAVDIFQRLEPDCRLELMERRGLLRIEQDDRRLTLRLDHPLHGEALRSKLSVLTLRETARRLADAVEATGARRRSDVLGVAVWRLECGGPFNPDLMLNAALDARQRNDFPLAERLARAAMEAGAGFDASLLVGQLRWYQRRARQAEDHLSAMESDAATDAQKALLACARIEILDLGLNDIDKALAVAQEAEASIADVVFRDQIAAERARVLGRRGRNAEAVAIVEPLLERAGGRTLVAACFAASTSMAVTGQVRQGVAASELGYETHIRLAGPPVGYPPALHRALQVQVYAHAGYLERAWDLGYPGYRKALEEHSPLAIGLFSMLLGMTAIHQGRMETAERLAGEANLTFRKVGLPFMERNALMTQAYALAGLGRYENARRCLEELDRLGIPDSDLCGPILMQIRASLEAASGNRARALEVLGEAVDLARWSGAKALESWTLHSYVRLGKAPEVAGALEELSRVVEGPFAPARALHARSVADGDACGMDAASVDLEKLGAMLLAAEASADAAVAWRRQGELRKATAAERRAQSLAALCEGAVSPVLETSGQARAVLTPRELEIAQLASSGLSDKEIADRLFLSHRTVENKLHSTYAKLGVFSRSELAGALESRPAP
jgi:DNA-binding CsgD family transcriptional regulator